jgi:DNA-binding transcriptional LysR family regulator
MIELRQLRYAVMTADTQSFSRAAAALNVKQSTLSRRVMQLEERLGVKLFERTTRGAEPTENGKVFIEQARRIVTDVDNLQTTARAVSYGEQGRLKATSFRTGLHPANSAWIASSPVPADGSSTNSPGQKAAANPATQASPSGVENCW